MRQLAALPPDQKPAAGRLANLVKSAIQDAIDARRQLIERAQAQVTAPALDITLPGVRPTLGREHPIRRTEAHLSNIFARLGFQVAEGPEIELEYYNFDALNIPQDHPSRDGFDTFYLGGDVLLRSNTSPVQIRVMESRQPPIRHIMPGRVYRPDTADATHSPVFHQIEGLVVDEGITFADLKGILTMAMQELFGPQTRTRFRPSFFPFTEPSVEIDMSWEGGWIEMGGAGMVDPNVLEAVGYDPEEVTGFAFGLGVERICMRQHGITDIRELYRNDVRFLHQF